MLFYHLILLLLFSFQRVAALPLPAWEQRLDRQSGSQPDLLDPRLNQPPPGLRPAHSLTLSPQHPTDLLQRRDPFPQLPTAQPSTVTSTQYINSPNGVVRETCIITLIPISGDAVREVKKCTLSTAPTVSSSVTAEGAVKSSSSSSVPTSSSIPTSSSSVLTSSSSVPTSASSVPTSSSSVPTSASSVPTSASSVPTSSLSVPTFLLSIPASSSSVPTSTSSVSASTSSIPTSIASSVGVKVNSYIPYVSSSASTSSSSAPTSSSSVPTSSLSVSTSSSMIMSTIPVPTSSSSVSTSSSMIMSTIPVPTSVRSSVGVKGASSVPASAASVLSTSASSLSGSLAAADATSDTVPGRKLSVLPIGLGVFAGISVIALVVVGLVTYERTKYRKAFRQRRLAESGAEMGYGGNAL